MRLPSFKSRSSSHLKSFTKLLRPEHFLNQPKAQSKRVESNKEPSVPRLVVRCAIWCHLYNLKNLKNTHGRVLILVKLQATLKLTLVHGCFSRFLNCTNGTKLHYASHLTYLSHFEHINFPSKSKTATCTHSLMYVMYNFRQTFQQV